MGTHNGNKVSRDILDTKSTFIGKADKGRRILNENIKRDYARLLEMITDVREPDFTEIEALANKYRFYFDEEGVLREYGR